MLAVRSAVDDPTPYLTVPGFEVTPDQLARQRPDELLLVLDGPRVVARCGLWFRRRAAGFGMLLGLVGHYFAASPEAGVEVLFAACERLKAEGCRLAVGPMDGSTWERYRLVTERGDEPPFFLEPDNPDDWPGHFAAAGFSPMARYCSALVPSLEELSHDAEAGRRLQERGVTVRTLDPERFTEELSRIYDICRDAFVYNFLYMPIDEDGFLALYAPLRPIVRPELVLLAEKGSELVGFIFAVPDLLQPRRGRPIDTGIIKTMAVRPRHTGIGLGGHLMDRAHHSLRQAGFRRAIHALYHEDNRSGRISRRTAQVIRRYTLFSRML